MDLNKALVQLGAEIPLAKFKTFGVTHLHQVADLEVRDLEEIGLNRRQVRLLQRYSSESSAQAADAEANTCASRTVKCEKVIDVEGESRADVAGTVFTSSGSSDVPGETLPKVAELPLNVLPCKSDEATTASVSSTQDEMFPDNDRIALKLPSFIKISKRRVHWLPDGWSQGMKTTSGGKQRVVYISPAGHIKYHREDVENFVSASHGQPPKRKQLRTEAVAAKMRPLKIGGCMASDAEVLRQAKSAALALLGVDSNQKGGGGAALYVQHVDALRAKAESLRNHLTRAKIRRLIDAMDATKQLKTPGTFKVFVPFILMSLGAEKVELEEVYERAPGVRLSEARKTKDVRTAFYKARAMSIANAKIASNAKAKRMISCQSSKAKKLRAEAPLDVG